MFIKENFAALTTNGGEVLGEQVFTELMFPNMGIKSEATLIWTDAPKQPKPIRRVKADERQMTLF